jgi:hypothetical protein|tara:strand:+ start:10264 stop:10437 length:174 start_codon:yes stop_codon:yes gene_type:complete
MDTSMLINILIIFISIIYFYSRSSVLKLIPKWLDDTLVLLLAFFIGWAGADIIVSLT